MLLSQINIFDSGINGAKFMCVKSFKKMNLHYFWYCFAVIISLFGCNSVANNSNEQLIPEKLQVPILFATNRLSETSKKGEIVYTEERGSLSYGFIHQEVDSDDALDSKFSSWQRWNAYQSKQVNTPVLCETSWLRSHCLDNLPEPEAPRKALLYIHGAGRSFDEAAEHFATLMIEIDFQGLPILFTWPTSDNTFDYVSDITNADWSVYYLSSVIEELFASGRFDTVQIMAHSLGNRVLLSTLKEIKQKHIEFPRTLENIVLMTADVDKDIFIRDYLPTLQQLEVRKSLYISDNDFPLKVSSWLNGHHRLGDANHLPIVFDQIETVDFSNATRMSGHSAYRKNSTVQEELHELFVNGIGAEKRPNLIKKTTKDGDYWELQVK